MDAKTDSPLREVEWECWRQNILKQQGCTAEAREKRFQDQKALILARQEEEERSWADEMVAYQAMREAERAAAMEEEKEQRQKAQAILQAERQKQRKAAQDEKAALNARHLRELRAQMDEEEKEYAVWVAQQAAERLQLKQEKDAEQLRLLRLEQQKQHEEECKQRAQEELERQKQWQQTLANIHTRQEEEEEEWKQKMAKFKEDCFKAKKKKIAEEKAARDADYEAYRQQVVLDRKKKADAREREWLETMARIRQQVEVEWEQHDTAKVDGATTHEQIDSDSANNQARGVSLDWETDERELARHERDQRVNHQIKFWKQTYLEAEQQWKIDMESKKMQTQQCRLAAFEKAMSIRTKTQQAWQHTAECDEDKSEELMWETAIEIEVRKRKIGTPRIL